MSWAYCEPKSSTSTRSLVMFAEAMFGEGAAAGISGGGRLRETKHYRTRTASQLVAALPGDTRGRIVGAAFYRQLTSRCIGVQILLTNDDGIYAPAWRRWSGRLRGWAT